VEHVEGGPTSPVFDPDGMRTFIRSVIAEFASRRTRRIPDHRGREFKMTFGCCVQAARYAEAYMVLCDSGLSLEARASARAALEHAVTVEWAYFRVGGLDRLANSATATSWDIRDRLHRWRQTVDAPGDRPEFTAAEKVPRLTSHEGLLRQLDPNDVLLNPGYAVLSQGVHVTNQTVTGFFRTIKEQRDIQINHHRQDNLADYTLHLVAASCMLVSWIQAHVLENEERLQELDEISDALGLPIRLDDVWAESDRTHP
jgi:hypothetical protein